MHKRGLFFSLDAAFALFLTLFFVTFILYTLSQLDTSELTKTELLAYSQSVAETMEVQDSYSSAAAMSNFLANYTRPGICYNITLYTHAHVSLYSVLTPGCTQNSYPITIYRTYIQNNDSFSYVFFQGWYQ